MQIKSWLCCLLTVYFICKKNFKKQNWLIGASLDSKQSKTTEMGTDRLHLSSALIIVLSCRNVLLNILDKEQSLKTTNFFSFQITYPDFYILNKESHTFP